MTILVPYDASALSRTALSRARGLADHRDDDLIVLAVVPDDADYARDHGWLDPGDQFDVGVIARKLRQEVRDIAPAAEFRHEFVENTEPTASLTTDVVRTIREVAAEVAPELLVIGTENASEVSAPIASVGGPLADDARYDVYVVRHADGDVAQA